MTVIVGLETADKAYIGGDSAVSIDNRVEIYRTPKIHRVGAFIIGGCGYSRTSQLIRKLNVRAREVGESTDDFLIDGFAYAVRQRLESEKNLAQGGHYEAQHNSFLVIYESKLYTLYSDFAIIRTQRGYDAIGSGGEFALGALSQLIDSDVSPIEKIRKAMLAAAMFTPSVAPPFGFDEA